MDGGYLMAKQRYKTLGTFLRWYYNYCQKNIVLVYRGVIEENWAKRCLYLDDKYHNVLGYNHRSILDNEIVFEYDEPDKRLNEKLVAKVITKLSAAGIKYSKWFSGNKSTHVHILLRDYTVRNMPLFKNVIMRHFGTYYVDKNNTIFEEPREGCKKIYPDLRLATKGHLIRAEFGIHEKTQDYKELIYMSPGYPCKSKIPIDIFEKYQHAQERSVRQRVSQTVSEVAETETFKNLLNSVLFREGMDDGRERVMWQIIQVLKHKFKDKGQEGKEELVALMWDWYKYSSTQGLKMTEEEIKRKVDYHWGHNYHITEKKLLETVEEVGGKLGNSKPL